jgi:hypothetical protein
MRLYRGLKEPYRPEKVGLNQGTLATTDFTDCPYTALRYAQGRRAVVLVLDVTSETRRVTEELWPGAPARRFMVWGRFDEFLVAALPAKELRAHVRVKGVVAASDQFKARVLARAIAERVGQPTAGSPADDMGAS